MPPVTAAALTASLTVLPRRAPANTAHTSAGALRRTGRLLWLLSHRRRAALAQSAERFTRNEQVVGSIPTGGSTNSQFIAVIDDQVRYLQARRVRALETAFRPGRRRTDLGPRLYRTVLWRAEADVEVKAECLGQSLQ
jgi:hypothetical protein